MYLCELALIDAQMSLSLWTCREGGGYALERVALQEGRAESPGEECSR